MSATVVRLASIATEDEPQIAVPAAHLRRLLELESELGYALNYTRPGCSMRAGRVKRLRKIHEGES